MSAPPGTVIDGIRVIPDPDERRRAGRRAAAAGVGDAPWPTWCPTATATRLGSDPSARRRARGRRASPSALAPGRHALAVSCGRRGAGRWSRWPSWWCWPWWPAAWAGGTTASPVTHPVPSLVEHQRGHPRARRSAPTTGSSQRTDVGRGRHRAGPDPGPEPDGRHPAGQGQRALDLVVSTGPPPVPVPTDLAGHSPGGRTAELQADGLALGAVTYQFDEDKAQDVVLGLAPAACRPSCPRARRCRWSCPRAQAPDRPVDRRSARRWPRPPRRSTGSACSRHHVAESNDRARRSGARRHPARRHAGAQGRDRRAGRVERSADGRDPGRHHGHERSTEAAASCRARPDGQRHPGHPAGHGKGTTPASAPPCARAPRSS